MMTISQSGYVSQNYSHNQHLFLPAITNAFLKQSGANLLLSLFPLTSATLFENFNIRRVLLEVGQIDQG